MTTTTLHVAAALVFLTVDPAGARQRGIVEPARMADRAVCVLSDAAPALLRRSGRERNRHHRRRSVFIETNRRLRDALQHKGYDVRYVEVPGPVHNPTHWRTQLAPGLIYLDGPGGGVS